MKRYTVKEVIKMEDKQQRLHQIDKEGLAEDYFMPLALLTSIGVCSVLEFSQAFELVPLIIGSITAIFGGTSLTHLFSAGMRSNILYDKLTKIYDIMGDDFKNKVEQERQKQEFDKNGRSR